MEDKAEAEYYQRIDSANLAEIDGISASEKWKLKSGIKTSYR